MLIAVLSVGLLAEGEPIAIWVDQRKLLHPPGLLHRFDSRTGAGMRIFAIQPPIDKLPVQDVNGVDPDIVQAAESAIPCMGGQVNSTAFAFDQCILRHECSGVRIGCHDDTKVEYPGVKGKRFRKIAALDEGFDHSRKML